MLKCYVKMCIINDQKTCIKLRFIDSYKFLNTSLDKLSSFLSKDKLRILQRKFFKSFIENFNLLTRKDVFPYEYINCTEKLEGKCLPSRESLYSLLTSDTVSESDYARRQRMAAVLYPNVREIQRSISKLTSCC